MARITNALEKGKIATTSIVGSLSGVLRASEVLVYLLKGTDLVSRNIIFVPKFAVIDLLQLTMEVVDLTILRRSAL